MKKLQILAIAMLFAMTGIDFIQAEIACPAGQERRKKGGKCIKKTTEHKDNTEAKVATGKAANKALAQLKTENAAVNTINAYNAAINASSPNAQTVSATTTAATTAINNVVNMYNNYLTSIQNGAAIIFGRIPATTTATSANFNISAGNINFGGATSGATLATTSGATPAYVSSCEDGSTATCQDGTVISGVSCAQYDGSTDMSDVNGICATYGTAIPCNDGVNYPLCKDGNTPA